MDDNNKNKQYLDKGYDYDKDKHCDIDGWYVNKNGNHRPILRIVNDDISSKAFSHQIDIISSKDYFNAYGSINGIQLSPLYEYSLNQEDLELSSPNLNKSLRTGRFTEKVIKRISELDYIIIILA